ncbi:MAG: FISUMP domain-containing protein [Bacteroidales bacterium]|nr:FISUMP domain-containing protein [Bacteroidales bacterium]
MSQNLNFVVPIDRELAVYQWLCPHAQTPYEQSEWCDQVGKMYRINAVVENPTDDELTPICPEGWRLPAKEDWKTLFASVGGEQNARELRYGGKSDFNALDLGYISYYFVPDPEKFWIIKDTIFEHKETYKSSWFFSTTEPYDPNHTRADIWQWNTNKAGEVWAGYGSLNLYMPVRCVKED